MKKLLLSILVIFTLTGCGKDYTKMSPSAAAYEQLEKEEKADIKDKEGATVRMVKLDGPVTVSDENYLKKDVFKVDFDNGVTVYVSIDKNLIVARAGVV